ncbi:MULTISPECIES: vanadium-dependent haloperoxidase [unclassified Coleofasciculus]|uniref:vanadium-dependent haloperoxidase n=1 Tax=unclassified Coleofasciculus TaxID=2692782 RepID=UPI0018821893|nr:MULTISPECIES: vanadium-dependent haloperoxidase [unclassified Coleofasciculus]MBE9124589.1 vanadium-dependent haloperoxidase [Coleofasciculus sp. LEGE 07081]MBE9147552.1 vanadium-dependent haloperoxidase [Coleofasciculus sp. LEGE 07092]
MKKHFSRRTLAREVREESAEIAFLRPHPEHLNNGEESAYRNSNNELSYIANYSKGLPHNQLGEVEPTAYRIMLKALCSGNYEDFEKIPRGCSKECQIELPESLKSEHQLAQQTKPGEPKLLEKYPPEDKPEDSSEQKKSLACRRFTNPQAGLAFDLEGPDAQSLAIPPAPRIDGAENSCEAIELYWMALLRDVNFTDFRDNNGIDKAAEELSSCSDFRGPKEDCKVTPDTIFRGLTPGDLVGPFLSQFLLKDIQYGTLTINQRQRTVVPQKDFMTDYKMWLAVQNGFDFSGQDKFDSVRRYIRNMRDLGNYVHFDALYEAYLNACLILLDIKAPFDRGNPYITSSNQDGFGTFGGPHILSLVTEVATRALKAVWYQKWFVHRRLRPEALGGLIHNHLTGKAKYPIDQEILNSQAVQEIFNKNGTYLLPQVFPEGSPTHPAYGAGHATVAGACVTMLKAWFDESYVMPKPVVPNADGTQLVSYIPYSGPGTEELTVGGELNKLAANISIGRNMAGVHWRTDYTESVKLGEAIAIGILQEQKLTYNEDGCFSLTKFDGTAITI